MINRRAFIRDCSAFAVSVAAVAVQAGSPLRHETFEFKTFAHLVNSGFIAQKSGQSQALDLVEATGHRKSFSLLFRGSAEAPLEQDTYSFEHERLGQFQMFIVPVGRPHGSGCYYEAVFNHATEEFYG